MKRWRFEARLFRPDGPRMMTVVPIPSDVAKSSGFRARQRVKGFINDVEIATSLQSSGEGWLAFVVNKDLLKKLDRKPGDIVRIDLERDEGLFVTTVPIALQEALDGDPIAKQAFTDLSPTHRRAYAQWIESAKRQETRNRRVSDAIGMLRNGRKLR